MGKWVKLRNEDGQFFDRALGFQVRRGEIVELPDPLPPGSETATAIRLKALVLVERPSNELAAGEIIESVPQVADDNYENAQAGRVPEVDEVIDSATETPTDKLSETPGPLPKPVKEKSSFWDKKKKAPVKRKTKSGN